MKLLRSIATVGGFTIGSRVVGFVREMLMATYLGAGAMTDAMVFAMKLPSFLRRLFAEGAFNAAFVPLFAGALAKEGEQQARTLAEDILAWLTLSLTVLVIVVELFLPQIMSVIAPGFAKTPERLHLAIEYTRLTFPFILFISLTALYSGILNSLERFAAVASSPMVGNVAIIASVYLMTAAHGEPGEAFAIGVTACGIVQLLWVLIPAKRYGFGLRPRMPRLTPEMKRFLKLFAPAAAGSGVVQVNLLVDMLVASLLPAGGMSYLHYADRLNQLPLSVLGTAVGTALLPLLAKQLRMDQHEQAMESQNLALEYALLLTLPAMIGLIFLAQPLIQVLFQHGKFGPHETLETAKTLMALALGLPAYVMIKIFSSTFFARQDTFTPVAVGVGSMALNLALNLMLIDRFQHVGLGASTAIAAWANAGVLAWMLKKRNLLILSSRFLQFFPRLIMTTALTIAVLMLADWAGRALLDQAAGWRAVVVLCTMVGTSIFAYGLLARLTGAVNWRDMRQQLRGA
ncbi:MAG: murein biosynthesis integral membrane protein MurJ [Holosporales bacterium]